MMPLFCESDFILPRAALTRVPAALTGQAQVAEISEEQRGKNTASPLKPMLARVHVCLSEQPKGSPLSVLFY